MLTDRQSESAASATLTSWSLPPCAISDGEEEEEEYRRFWYSRCVGRSWSATTFIWFPLPCLSWSLTVGDDDDGE
jgi:hypothetical protein